MGVEARAARRRPRRRSRRLRRRHGTERLGKTTLLRLVAGLAAPTAASFGGRRASQLGFLGHEPLENGELTAARTCCSTRVCIACPSRASGVGMLLERFGLWDARNERVASYSRGMLQRLALCRVFLHDPSLLLLDEPYSALDSDGGAARPRAGAPRPRHVPRLDARAGTARAARVGSAGAGVNYLRDSAALARKLTCCSSCARGRPPPAMVLFVVATLVVFRFAPGDASDRVAIGTALGGDPLHRSPGVDARVRP